MTTPSGQEPIDPAIEAAMRLDGDVEALQRYYQDWADTYETDVGAERYALPDQVAILLRLVVDRHRDQPIDGLTSDPGAPDAPVMDAGCGTGLVGARLWADGYRVIDGVDLSPAMMEQAAERGCYRMLRGGVDLTAPLPSELIGGYDIVCVGGLFTVGHLAPETLGNVAQLARPGGLLLTTTRRQYHEESGYVEVSAGLEARGRLRLIQRTVDAPYTLDSPGDYWAYVVLEQWGASTPA